MEKTGSKRTNIPDRELIAQATSGDQVALTLLLERYRGPLIAHLMNYVKVVEDAEDICQKSFLIRQEFLQHFYG
jgi:DNA-directed RNA polymerase specialized sigma24 family protein